MLRPRDRVVDSALHTLKLQINEWSVIDFIKHFLSQTLCFVQKTKLSSLICIIHPNVVLKKCYNYYFINQTYQVCETFLEQCYLVCNKKNGKKNAIFIVGDSNAGKTAFIDSLTSFFLNRGTMRNPNRQELFSFQECSDRRVLYWDEAKLDPAQYDNVKRLLAGDNCAVAVKYKEDQIVQKTPIFICSNNDIFQRNDEFYNRVLSFRWYTYPLWPKRFNPISIALLMA